MKNLLVSIFDVKAEVFAAPVLFRTIEEARRAYTLAIQNDPTLRQFPSDYELYQIGTFDVENGVITSDAKKICSVADLIAVFPQKENCAVPAGTFPVPASSSEVDTASSQTDSPVGEKRHFSFGAH